MKKIIAYVGLDVHKYSITVALLRYDRKDHEFVKKLPNNIKKLRTLLKELSKKYDLRICYEAGGCGNTIYRKLTKSGYNCMVAAPSLIPTDRNGVKTDKRDAKKLALYLKAGILTPVNVPDEAMEMDRDLVRFRVSQVKAITRVKQQIKAFLLRKDIKYDEQGISKNWSKPYLHWLETVKLDPKDRSTLNKYIGHLNYQTKFVSELEQEIEELSRTERYKDLVEIIKAFRGIETTTAMIMLTNIPDFRSFTNPKYLTSYIGVTPREDSSGESINRYGITKHGNKLLRKAVIAIGQHYSKADKVCYQLRQRRQKLPSTILAVVDRADRRCKKKYFKMIFAGKNTNKAKVWF